MNDAVLVRRVQRLGRLLREPRDDANMIRRFGRTHRRDNWLDVSAELVDASIAATLALCGHVNRAGLDNSAPSCRPTAAPLERSPSSRLVSDWPSISCIT